MYLIHVHYYNIRKLVTSSSFSFPQMLNRHGYAAKDVASRGKNSVALSMLRQHDEVIDAKSPRLTPRALHTRDITSVSPNIVRRNNALLST